MITSLALVVACRSSHQKNTKTLAVWTSDVVSLGVDTGGWNGRQMLEYKQRLGTIKAQQMQPATVNAWTAKASSNTGYCQPRQKQKQKTSKSWYSSLSHNYKTTPVIISLKQVYQYSGVAICLWCQLYSLVLPDVRFGLVFQYQLDCKYIR